MKGRRYARAERGFTLVELLVVILVLATPTLPDVLPAVTATPTLSAVPTVPAIPNPPCVPPVC